MLYKQKGSKLWWTKFKIGGVTVRKPTGKANRREAEAEARRIRVEYENAGFEIESRGPTPRLTDLAAYDLERAQNSGLTKQHYTVLELQWGAVLKVLGDIAADTIEFDVLEDYIGRRRTNGVRGQTIRRELAALRRGLKIAKRRGLIASIPDDWPVVRGDPPDPKRRGKLVPPEVLRVVLAEVPQDLRDELEFVALTGLRGAELKRVEAGWVEPLPPGAPVPAALRIPPHASKTREERIVGLPRAAVELIRKRVSANPKEQFVFSQSNFKHALQNACKGA